MTYRLAIHTQHTSTIALEQNGFLLEVVSEERFTGRKTDDTFPLKSIFYVIEKYKIESFKQVIFCSNVFNIFKKFPRKRKKLIVNYPLFLEFFLAKFKDLLNFKSKSAEKSLERGLKFFLDNIHIPVEKFSSEEHHPCHAYAAYTLLKTDDFNGDLLVISIDGQGDGVSTMISTFDSNGKMEVHATAPWYQSLGELYASTTEALGMKKMEHEYKVMGLASYAKEEYFSEIKLNVFDKIIKFDCKTGLQATCKSTRNLTPMLVDAIKGQRFDNVAGALQKCTEDIVLKIFEYWTKKFPKHKIIFTGGVVMNVKINLILHSIYGDKIRFMPSGGDESLPIGALARDHCPNKLKTPNLLFFGPEYESSEIVEHFKNTKFNIIYDNALDKAAKLIANGEIVARFSGRSEWGARSLGNRAVLADPSKMESFHLVNDYIKVRDFWMPFAPTILDIDVKKYLQFSSKYAPYMINAMKTTELGSNHLRAAKHQTDNTVRAQILRKEDSESFYRLIKKFKKISGIGALLNTSLNIHGDPLATTPMQLKHTVVNSMLKYVLVNDELLIVKK